MSTSGVQESLTCFKTMVDCSLEEWYQWFQASPNGTTSSMTGMIPFIPTVSSTRRVQSRRPENTSGGVSCIEISGYKMFMCELLWSSVWSILLVTILIHFKLPYMIKPYWQHLHDFFIVLLFVCCMFWSFSGKLGLACIWEELYFSIQTGFFQEKYKINPGVKVLSILDLWSIHL